MNHMRTPFEIYHDNQEEIPVSPINAAYHRRMLRNLPRGRPGVSHISGMPPSPPRRRTREQSPIPVPFALPPGHYRTHLPRPPLLIEGEDGGQGYMTESDESPVIVNRSYSVVNIEEEYQAPIAPDVDMPWDDIELSPVNQSEIDFLYDDAFEPSFDDELLSSTRAPHLPTRRQDQFSPIRQEELLGAAYVSPSRPMDQPAWDDIQFSPITQEELIDAQLERDALEAKQALNLAFEKVLSFEDDSSRSVEALRGTSSDFSDGPSIMKSIVKDRIQRSKLEEFLKRDWYKEFLEHAKESRVAIERQKLLDSPPPRPRPPPPRKLSPKSRYGRIGKLVSPIKHQPRTIMIPPPPATPPPPPSIKPDTPKSPPVLPWSPDSVFSPIGGYLPRENLSEDSRAAEELGVEEPRTPLQPIRLRFSPSPPLVNMAPLPNWYLLSPSPTRRRQPAPITPERMWPIGVPLGYLNPDLPPAPRCWRKMRRAPLPRLRKPMPNPLPPEYAFLNQSFHYPEGRVSLSGAVLEKSLDESSVKDDLDITLNESMAAQTSWASWQAGSRPPIAGFGQAQIPPHKIQEPIQGVAMPGETEIPELLEKEFAYYAGLLEKHSPRVSEPAVRKSVARWVKKLFGMEYHGSTILKERRNRYMLSLCICVLVDVMMDFFLQPPPEGILPDPEDAAKDAGAGFSLRDSPAWERDESWDEVLKGIPDPGVLDLPCKLHPPGWLCPESNAARAAIEGAGAVMGDRDKDAATAALLDREYRFLFGLIKPYAALLRNPIERTLAASWMQALCAIADDSTSEESQSMRRRWDGGEGWPCALKRGLRNDYIQALLGYLSEKRLTGPFAVFPPNNGEGGPLPTLRSAALASGGPAKKHAAIFSLDPTSPLAEDFLSGQPKPQNGAFCYVAVTGDVLESSLSEGKEPDLIAEEVVRGTREMTLGRSGVNSQRVDYSSEMRVTYEEPY